MRINEVLAFWSCCGAITIGKALHQRSIAQSQYQAEQILASRTKAKELTGKLERLSREQTNLNVTSTRNGEKIAGLKVQIYNKPLVVVVTDQPEILNQLPRDLRQRKIH